MFVAKVALQETFIASNPITDGRQFDKWLNLSGLVGLVGRKCMPDISKQRRNLPNTNKIKPNTLNSREGNSMPDTIQKLLWRGNNSKKARTNSFLIYPRSIQRKEFWESSKDSHIFRQRIWNLRWEDGKQGVSRNFIFNRIGYPFISDVCKNFENSAQMNIFHETLFSSMNDKRFLTFDQSCQ